MVHEPLFDEGNMPETLMHYYRLMLEHFGESGWWPADSPFEVSLGAILTQNTSWRNVELALDQLRQKSCLIPKALQALPDAELEEAIRPAGFFRQKTQYIRAWLAFLALCGERPDQELSCLAAYPTGDLRKKLLAIKGVGPETADSILLYALNRPVFVIDAYTRRIFSRHELFDVRWSYDAVQAFFMRSLAPETALYNEYHALIVRTAKDYCRKGNPRCGECPLQTCLPENGLPNSVD